MSLSSNFQYSNQHYVEKNTRLSTYLCESGFVDLNNIKTKKKENLKTLDEELPYE